MASTKWSGAAVVKPFPRTNPFAKTSTAAEEKANSASDAAGLDCLMRARTLAEFQTLMREAEEKSNSVPSSVEAEDTSKKPVEKSNSVLSSVEAESKFKNPGEKSNSVPSSVEAEDQSKNPEEKSNSGPSSVEAEDQSKNPSEKSSSCAAFSGS